MNAIVMKERIDLYNDRVRSARFTRYNYDQAINDAIRMFIENRIGSKKVPTRYSFESMQQVRDELYTIIKVQNSVPGSTTSITNQYYTHQKSTISFPSDYYFLAMLLNTIDGFSDYARPTTYNELGPLLQDSFRHPANNKTYYIENATGLDIYWGPTGSFTQASLTYLKHPAQVTIGASSQLISSGASVLSIGTSYIATEVSVSNGVTYQVGVVFTAAVVTLTSGQVIPASAVTDCDLPEKTQQEICVMASQIMMGTISDFNKSGFSQNEADKM